MSRLGSAIQTTVNSILSSFGVLGVLKRVTEASYDPVAGSSSSSSANYSIRMTAPSPYRESQINGTSILMGDVWADVSSKNLAVTPRVNDEVTCAGKTYKVVDCELNYLQSVIVSYRLHLRF